MASEMVERVATAIVEKLRTDARNYGAYLASPSNYDKRLSQYDGEFDHMLIARAAISAMREPTEAMMVLTHPRHIARLNWQAMIGKPKSAIDAQIVRESADQIRPMMKTFIAIQKARGGKASDVFELFAPALGLEAGALAQIVNRKTTTRKRTSR